MSVLDDIRFWHQVAEDARRTVFCSPELESRVKTMIAVLGIAGVVDVQVSPFVPDDQIFVADPNSLEASNNQALTRTLNNWSWFR